MNEKVIRPTTKRTNSQHPTSADYVYSYGRRMTSPLFYTKKMNIVHLLRQALSTIRIAVHALSNNFVTIIRTKYSVNII